MVARGLLRVSPDGDRIRGKRRKMYIFAANCLRVAADPLPWPFGPHVVGYK